MMAGVTIVYAIEAGNDPVQDAGCGISVPADHPTCLAEAIRGLMKMDQSSRVAMGARGVPYAKSNYLYPALAEKFLMATTGTEI